MSNHKKQFIYILRPAPHLREEANWTEKENEAVGRHFAFLKKLLGEGRLILAGKTDGLDERTFGIVILEAASEQEAFALMRSDPGVAEGIMGADLIGYHVALMRGNEE